MISLIVPAAGLFRHNETLWTRIAADQTILPFELVIPVAGEISPRLKGRLAQLKVGHRFVVIPSTNVGALLEAGIHGSRGDWLVWLHDDALPDHVAALLRKLTEREGGGLRVPIVRKSHNVDQAEGKPITTRPIDRSCFAFRRDEYTSLELDVSRFAIDGYQVAIQAAYARRGIPVWIEGARISHEGSQTLCNAAEEDWNALFQEDMRIAAETMGTYAEADQRPAIPRLIPAGLIPEGYEHGQAIDVTSPDVDELVNLYDSSRFTYKRETYGRVTMGDRFSIPPIMDTYDVALVKNMGFGDLLMHSSAVWHFKQLYPWVRFRVFTYSGPAIQARRVEAFDDVIELKAGDSIPSTAREWDVANGLEGTPIRGFRELGIEELVPIGVRRMSPYRILDERTIDVELPANSIGIQLNGGWLHKRYGHANELAGILEAQGFTPVFFGTAGGIETDPRFLRISTPTLDDFAAHLAKLSAWIGFDSGASYLANALGIPSVWIFASHDPRGLIGACGANAAYRTIWPALPLVCARRHGISCRPFGGAAFAGYGKCGLRLEQPGAECLDSIDPRILAGEVVNLLEEFTS